MFKSLLIPIDGSKDSHAALQVACQLAAPVQGKLHLLHVRDPYPNLSRGEMLTVAAAIQAAAAETTLEEGHKILEEAVARNRNCPGYDNEWDCLVRVGSPAEVIMQEAERLNVDAIVMGSRGLSDFRGLMIGSVSHKVTHVAKCRVISIHERGHASA